MFRIAIKDLLARKRRLITTSIAVLLGIAFLTGTQLLSATLSDSIKSLVGDVYEGVDAVVRSPKTTETPFGQPLRTPINASVMGAGSARKSTQACASIGTSSSRHGLSASSLSARTVYMAG